MEEIKISRKLLREVGVKSAYLLSYLIYEYDDAYENGGLTEDGYLYCSVDYLQDKLKLSDYQQRRILNQLKSLGLLDYKSVGFAPKRYIKLFENEIISFLTEHPV